MSAPLDRAGLRRAIEARLSELTDPGAGLDVLRLGLVRNLEIAGDGTVSMAFRPSSPVCPIAFSLAPAIREAVGAIPGVKAVRMRVENFNRAAELEALLAADGLAAAESATDDKGDGDA